MPKAKYIKTKDKEIIVFGEIMLHSVLTHKGNCNNPIHSFKQQEQ